MKRIEEVNDGYGVQFHPCLQWVRDSLRLSLASHGIAVRNRPRSSSPLVNRRMA